LRDLFDAFFFEQTGTKKKAWQKRNAVYSGHAPRTPATFFEKKFDQKTKLGAARTRSLF